MKTSTFDTRTKAFQKSSNGYILAKMLVNGEYLTKADNSTRFYTCFSPINSHDYTEDVARVLNAAGLKIDVDFRVDNDDPRGEIAGNYIELIK